MLDRRFLVGSMFTLLAAATFPTAATASSCFNSSRAAATLLFPYFEVDAAASRTTLISIGNASAEPTLAQVVVWSNCGVPVLDSTLYLAADAVQPLDLRSVLVGGKIPVTGPGGGVNPFSSCGDPLPRPTLDAAARDLLRMRLTGQPDPDSGLCYAQPVGDSSALVGYLTVDVLNDCSETVRTPLDEGYFEHGGQGLASNRNALWGDFFFVDDSGDTAQGFEAVSVVADAQSFIDGSPTSFYSRGTGDDRLPLGSRYRARFLNGGGFDGGTEIILWWQPADYDTGGLSTPPCERGCGGLHSVSALRVITDARDEQGGHLAIDNFFVGRSPIKLRVGSEPLRLDAAFGSLDLSLLAYCGPCDPPHLGPIQGWVMPLYTAAGRFSVGLSAVRLDDPCQ